MKKILTYFSACVLLFNCSAVLGQVTGNAPSNLPAPDAPGIFTYLKPVNTQKSSASLYLSGEIAVSGNMKVGNIANFYNARAAVITGSNNTFNTTQGDGYYQVEIGIHDFGPGKRDPNLYSDYGFGLGITIFTNSDFVWQDQIDFGQNLYFIAQPRIGYLTFFTSLIPRTQNSQMDLFLTLSLLYGEIYSGEYREVYGGGNPSFRDYSLSGTATGADGGIGLSFGKKFRIFSKLKYRYLPIPITFKDNATGVSSKFAVSNTDKSTVDLDVSGYSISVGVMF